MNIFVSVIALCAFIIVQVYTHNIFSTEVLSCSKSKNAIYDYPFNEHEFAVKVFQHIGSIAADKNLVFYPLSAWITLGVIAEGADPATKHALFQLLGLPNDPCIRQNYYPLAASRFRFSKDINISSTRTLIIDERLSINPIYQNFVSYKPLLEVVSAPLRSEPEKVLEEIKRITSANLKNFDLSGNSVLLDIVQYSGLWSTAFEDAVVEKSPFYSTKGDKIGYVDLMKVKRRARILTFKKLNMKCLELPMGHNDRYRLMFGIVLKDDVVKAINNFTGRTVIEYLHTLKESYKPIDIEIPRCTLTSEFDIKKILINFGLKSLWTDPKATEFISEPAAIPSAYVHRATFSLDKAGLKAARHVHQVSNKTSTSEPPDHSLAHEFIANKPFLMGLFDAETYSCIMAAAFTQPTYID